MLCAVSELTNVSFHHRALSFFNSICQSRKVTKKEQRQLKKGDPTSAFYWFSKEHGMRIADSLNQPITSMYVRRETQRTWKLMNALERKPYIDKAERVKEMTVSKSNSDGKAGEVKKPAAAM